MCVFGLGRWTRLLLVGDGDVWCVLFLKDWVFTYMVVDVVLD